MLGQSRRGRQVGVRSLGGWDNPSAYGRLGFGRWVAGAVRSGAADWGDAAWLLDNPGACGWLRVRLLVCWVRRCGGWAMRKRLKESHSFVDFGHISLNFG